MPSSRLPLALLGLAVILAGCTFGVGGDTLAPGAGTETGSESGTGSNVTDTDGSTAGPTSGPVRLGNTTLDLDADRTLDRVERLVEEDVESPTIWVYRFGLPRSGGVSLEYPYTPYPFVKHLDLTNVSEDGLSAAGLTDSTGRVYLVPRNSTEHQLQQVLVHEFVHVVQFRADLIPWDGTAGGDVTTDRAQTRLALLEGAAVWVTDEYTDRYLPATVANQSRIMADNYAAARVGGRYRLARYHFGALGIDRRLDDPSQLRSVFEDPPRTSEQLIHGLEPGSEPPRRVPVDASGGAGWQVADPTDVDVMGELFVRVALSRELSLDRSADAAAGWGHDRLVEFEGGGGVGFVWVTRWDDPANATAFHDALDTYIEGRSPPGNLTFRTDRLADEIVVFYSGPPAFVDAATATGDADGVRVTVEE